MRSQSWPGKLIASRWSDPELSNRCFDWLNKWKSCPTHVIAGTYELYEQRLNTRIYQPRVQTDSAHILVGCSAFAQSKYLHRHNSVLKIMFFEMLHDLELVDSVYHLGTSQSSQNLSTKAQMHKPHGISHCTQTTW